MRAAGQWTVEDTVDGWDGGQGTDGSSDPVFVAERGIAREPGDSAELARCIVARRYLHGNGR